MHIDLGKVSRGETSSPSIVIENTASPEDVASHTQTAAVVVAPGIRSLNIEPFLLLFFKRWRTPIPSFAYI